LAGGYVAGSMSALAKIGETDFKLLYNDSNHASFIVDENGNLFIIPTGGLSGSSISGYINSTAGLVVENRTDDPVSPEVGRI